jgi:hypothetical protein
MGWFGDLSEQRKRNMAILQSLQTKYEGTEVTFNQKYASQGFLTGNLWALNSMNIIKANEKLLEFEEIERIVLSQHGLPSSMAILFTNKRIISVSGVSNLPFIATWEDLRAFEKINFWGECRISTRNNDDALKIAKGTIKPQWYDMIESYFNYKLSSQSKAQNPPASNHIGSLADELSKFAQLRDQGIITEDEFILKKKQLLKL